MKAILQRLAVVAALTTVAWASAMADSWTFKSDLSGKNESPPNDSPATGTAVANYDTATRMLTWHVEFSGLTGPAIGAHIHGPAASGANAGIMQPFPSPVSPIDGSATLTEAQEKSLVDGTLYVNIHTEAHPAGELRGQLVKQ